MKKIIVLLIMITATQISIAGLSEKLQEKWRWVKFGVQSGLPSDKDIKIIEAIDGTIWACTPKGFAWYDGYIWQSVNSSKNDFKISDFYLAEPNNKEGLIAPCNGKLAIINTDSIVIKELSLNNKPVTLIESVIYDNNRLLLSIASRDKKYANLYLYDNHRLIKLTNSFSFKLFSNTEKYLYRDRNNNLWLNSETGYFLLHNNKWILKKENMISEPFDICKPIINKSGRGFVSIGFPSDVKGVWNLDYDNEKMKYSHYFSTALTDGDMNIEGEVFSVHLGGIYEVFQNNNWSIVNNLPVEIDNAVRVTFISNGNLWVSGERGLFLCNLSTDRWEYHVSSDNNNYNYVNDIIKDKQGKIWIATGDGLMVLNANQIESRIKKINTVDLIGTTGLIEDAEGSIWISSGANYPSAYKWDENRWSYVKIGHKPAETYIHKIKSDRANNLWFLTLSSRKQNSGFGAFQLKNGKYIHWDTSNGLLSNRVYDFVEDLQGAYWFGTLEGLCRYKNKVWTYWTTSNGLRSNKVYSLEMDKFGKIWFSDYKYGVGYVEKDSIKFNSILDDAEVTRVSSISFDNENKLWISSTSGLYYLNNDAVAYFNKNNGLLKSAVWPLLIEDDKVYVGTAGGGLNILSLKEKNEPLPKIFLRYKGESKGIYHIAWDVYSYWGQMPPEDIQVRYKIDNGEWSNWNLLRELKIDDISYGEHSFTIQAKGLFGDYEGTEKKIVFDVEYPFYFSPFFIAPIILLLTIALGYRHNYNKKKRESIENIKQMNINLNDKVNQQTKQISDALKNLKAEIMIRKQAEEELIIAKNNISKAYYKEKELNVLKSNTFSAISQEFKDPLTIISTSTELLEYYYKQNNDSSFKEKILNIKNSISNLFNIIEEIIVVGQFESNRIELVYEKFDLIVLAKDIIDNYSQHFKTKHNIRLNSEFNEYIIDSDRTFIRHIITNLLSNSIKFSSEGTEIIIEIIKINSKLAIKVKDFGVGIPNEYLDKIFEPFIRADNVKNINGTGFGLTVVKRAVELLGGDILCTSVVNEGTIFSVYLPLDKKQI